MEQGWQQYCDVLDKITSDILVLREKVEDVHKRIRETLGNGLENGIAENVGKNLILIAKII